MNIQQPNRSIDSVGIAPAHIRDDGRLPSFPFQFRLCCVAVFTTGLIIIGGTLGGFGDALYLNRPDQHRAVIAQVIFQAVYGLATVIAGLSTSSHRSCLRWRFACATSAFALTCSIPALILCERDFFVLPLSLLILLHAATLIWLTGERVQRVFCVGIIDVWSPPKAIMTCAAIAAVAFAGVIFALQYSA